MDIETLDIDFFEWFDLFYDKVRALGYKGILYKFSFLSDWEEGKTPEQAALEFINEQNDGI